MNHLKSKGSACDDVGDPDTGDGQANCAGTRTLAAEALVDWLASDPTGTGETDALILGDLNSYAKEDPIDAILAGSDDEAGTSDDWTNLIAKYQGTYAHSYVFDGQAGYLDHALASATMVGQVTGAADWHINADEPDRRRLRHVIQAAGPGSHVRARTRTGRRTTTRSSSASMPRATGRRSTPAVRTRSRKVGPPSSRRPDRTRPGTR